MRKLLYRYGIALIALQSCSQALESMESVTPISWVTPAVVAGNTTYQTFFSQSAKATVSYHVLLPDEYVQDPAREFTVLYWLHGSGGGNVGIPILADYFLKAMREEKIEPMIIVFPNGLPYGMWCNSKDGRQPVEDMFIRDLIPHIDTRYRTNASREGRILEGFSMGGFGAMRLGIKYSAMFRAISSLAGGPFQETFTDVAEQNENLRIKVFQEVFSNDMEYFIEQSPRTQVIRYGSQLPPSLRIRQIIGTADFSYSHNRHFRDFLELKDISFQYHEFQNVGHAVIPLFDQLGNSLWGFYAP